MKKTTLLVVTTVFFLLSSCIPSLHSIVNDENRITDDRLVGEWKMEEDIFDEETFSFKVESDDKADEEEGKKLMKEMLVEMKGKNKFTTWKFERAAKIVAKDEKALTDPKGHGLTMTLDIGGPSMLPESLNMTIIEKEEFPFYILTYKKSDGKKRLMRVDLTKINGEIYANFFPFGSEEENRFSMNYIHANTFAKIVFKEDKIFMQSFNIEKIEDLLKSKRVRLKHEIITKTVREMGKFVTEENIVLTASTTELRAFITKYGNDEDFFDEAEELIAHNE